MTTMVANATRVATVAEDATRLLGLRSPGARAADVTATKRRQAQLASVGVGKPVRSQVLSTAIAPGAGVGAASPLAALLDQPDFVAPALVGNTGPVGDGVDVAFANLPPPAFTPGGIVILSGGGSAGGGSGGSSGGGATTSTGGSTTTGGTGATSTGGDPSSGGGTTTSSGGTVDPNVPAVPEPSTWVMMLAGFAAIGTAMRRAVRRSPVRGG